MAWRYAIEETKAGRTFYRFESQEARDTWLANDAGARREILAKEFDGREGRAMRRGKPEGRWWTHVECEARKAYVRGQKWVLNE